MSEGVSARTRALTILVAEDSPTQREMLVFLLEGEGYAVVAASDGVEALAAAQSAPVDLVISDIVMPGLDGYGLCRSLRSEERLRHVPVILLTSLSDPRDVIRGLESGANNFVCKPYDDEALLARVRTVLANQELRSTSTTEMGISIFFAGQRFFITADRLQILDLLLSTYENAVSHNTELLRSRDELRALNEQLEARVADRTAKLSAEVQEHLAVRQREEHLTRILRAIRSINQLIVREKAPQALVAQACELLTSTHGYERVWIALRTTGARETVLVGSGWGEELRAHDDALRRGYTPPCWQRACATEQPPLTVEPVTECSGCPLARSYTTGGATVAPLRHGGQVFGTMGISTTSGTGLGSEEDELLLEMARDLAFALHAIQESEERRQGEERFQVSFERSPVGEALTSHEGRYLRVNTTLASMLGYQRDEMEGRFFDDFTYVNDLNVGRGAIAKLLDGAETSRFEKRYLHKSGRVVWADVSIATVPPRPGGTPYFITSVVDISERRRAEQLTALRVRLLDFALSASLADLLRETLDEVEQVVGSTVGFYHFVAEDQGSLSLQAWSTRTTQNACTAKGTGLHYDIEEAGVWADCVRERRPIVHNDYAALTHRRGLPEGHAPLVRELVVPIFRGDRIVAVLGTGNKATDFTEVDVETVSYLAEVAWEIAERKRAEEALRRSEETHRALYESSQDALMTLAPPRWTFTAANRATVRLFGAADEAELLSRGPADVSPRLQPDGAASSDGMTAMIAKAMVHGSAFFEWTHQRLDGTPFAATVLFTRMELAGIDVLQSTVRDISRQKEAERALEETLLFNESLLRTIPFPMDVVDHEGRILFMNEALGELLGAKGSELRCWSAYKDDGHQCPHCPLRQEIRIGETDAIEVAGVLGGRTVEIFHTGMMFQGKPALLEIFSDITEKKSVQLQLAQSDRLASMGTLAAGVAHEINNPLLYVDFNVKSLAADVPRLSGALLRCHEALLEHAGIDAADEALGADADLVGQAMRADLVTRFEAAVSGTNRIKEIARGLSTFSRVDQAEVAAIDLNGAVVNASNMALNEIKYRARLVHDLGDVPLVLGSDGKISQVVLNLLINAAHAIGDGHVDENEVRVRTWAEGDEVFVEVRDTGRGIAPEHRSRVFEPFFTTKGVGVGTGLGLSICKNIVTGFGGQMSFTSEVDRGTAFLVLLRPAPKPDEPAPSRITSPPDQVPRTRGRILVIDDEAGIRDTVTRLLRGDHDVIAAGSGAEAQAILRADGAFDVIYCDLMMPQMSGMELHAWLATHDDELARRVVFITGGAFTSGASDYLDRVGGRRVDKPFESADFRALTHDLVAVARRGT